MKSHRPKALLLPAAITLAGCVLASCQKPEVRNYNPIDESAIEVPTSCTEVAVVGQKLTCRVVASHLLDETARQGGMKGRYQVMDYDLTMVIDRQQLSEAPLSLVMDQPESTAKLTFRGNFTEPLAATISWRPSFELSPSSKEGRTVSHVKPNITSFDSKLPGFVTRIIRDQMNIYEAWQSELAKVATAAVTTAETKLLNP